jgi:hypothetical protein
MCGSANSEDIAWTATSTTQHKPLADIVASRPPWFRARVSTILVWPTNHGGWAAILHYAHYTTVQRGEIAPPAINVTYPHDTLDRENRER